MGVKVGINGFGRVGRVVFRTCLEHGDVDIAAINDPAVDVDYMCYLIKFDSTHGKLANNISHKNSEIRIDEKLVKIYHQKFPTSIPWKDAGVQYVVEASGMFTSVEKASGHLASETVKCIIVTAPSADVPMVLLGVNDKQIIEQKVISCGSSTLYCLAPIVKLLDDCFGIDDGFVTSIHAMTPSLKPLDGLCLRGKHWRDHRSIHQNIIPATTGACKALGKVIPSVKDKFAGLAFRVPIVNVSVLDLTVRLTKQTTLQEIVQLVQRESNGSFKKIMKVSRDEAVSSDFAADSHSCILDIDSCIELKPNYYKLICWYENEYSYACRVIDSILCFEKRINQRILPSSKITVLNLRPVKKQDMVQQTDCCISEKFPQILFHSLRNPGLKEIPQRSIVTRKPVLANQPVTNTSRDKKEIFKVWKDEGYSKPNRGSLYESCITFGPQSQKNECIRAQERLDKVKQEFSKMVNITEDLLKKSQTDTFKQQKKIKVAIDDDINDKIKTVDAIDTGKIICPKHLDICKTIQIDSAMFDVSGDGRSPSTVTSKLTNEHTASLDKDYSDLSFTAEKVKKFCGSCNTCSSEILQQTMDGIASNDKKMPNYNTTQHTNLKEHVTKTINTIIEGLSKNFEIQPCYNNNIENIGEKRENKFLVSPKIIKTGNVDIPVNVATIEPKCDQEGPNAKNTEINIPGNKSVRPLPDYQPLKDNTLNPKWRSLLSDSDKKQRLEEIAANFKLRFGSSSRSCTNGNENCKMRTSGKFNDCLKDIVPDIKVHTKLGEAKHKTISEDDDKSIKSNSTSSTFKPYTSEDAKQYKSVIDKQNELVDGNKDCVIKTDDTYSPIPKDLLIGGGYFSVKKLKTLLDENKEDKELNKKPSELSLQEKEQLLGHLIIDAIKRSKDQRNEDQIKTTENLNKKQDELVTLKIDNSIEKDFEQKMAEISSCHEKNELANARTDDIMKDVEKTTEYSSFPEMAKSNSVTNDVVSEDDTVSTSRMNSNQETYSCKMDIYDKLDSASDSDNSFENIGGRKSQVIDITDLTSSLEDIVRLDKICRIMEISDELSDKLFASLKNPENVASNKKWSFKDLCERINLDEFCNKVFGQSTP